MPKETVTVDPTSTTVTIPKAEYDLLVKAQRTLEALHAAGVDNWEWYDDALEDIRG